MRGCYIYNRRKICIMEPYAFESNLKVKLYTKVNDFKKQYVVPMCMFFWGSSTKGCFFLKAIPVVKYILLFVSKKITFVPRFSVPSLS